MNNTAAKTNSKFTIQQIAMIAVMTAVTCVLAPLSIPIGPVPISLTNLVIYFSLFILGTKKRNHQLPDLSSDRSGWNPGIFQLYQRSWQTLWTNRWLPDRIYPAGTDRRLLYRSFS